MHQPVAIDLFCGLGGWADGFLAEGIDVVGFDIERHDYGNGGYPGQLVIQDVRTLVGSQFKDALCLVASPPCTEYSYMAMPWQRAKQIAHALRGKDKFPDGYTGSRTVEQLNKLFNACFRIQREASEAAGRRIPLIVENVKGAQPWVGQAMAHFGSYFLWGDVGQVGNRVVVLNGPLQDAGVRPRSRAQKVPGFRFDGSGRSFQTASVKVAGQDWSRKNNGGSWFNAAHNTESGVNRNPVHDGTKQGGISGMRNNGKVDKWFQDGAAAAGSNSLARKAASAEIARIPLALARYVAKCFQAGVGG